MPKLSPTMEEGMIVKWHKKEGDAVKEGDLLFEVATDKATVEHNALDGGFLRKILVAENSSAHVNQAVAIFTKSKDESIDGYQPEGETKTEEVAEEESPTETPAEKPQKVTGLAQPKFVPAPPLTDYKFEFPEKGSAKGVASPLAKKLAKEQGIDLSSVKGTGPGGRVVKKDLEKATPGTPMVSFGAAGTPKEVPGSYDEETMTPMRKTIGQRLQESKTFIPHFYVQQEIDAEKMVLLREELKNNQIKLTFNDFVVRATALALKQHPHINSGFNSETGNIVRFKTIDVCIAVSVDGGLITPIVRHADYKNIGQLSAEVRHLATRAKDNDLKPEEYTGGSFTISNLGMFGINDFQAVINPPQAAILAVGGIIEKPVIKNHAVVPGKTLTLSLSSDHRVIDGADAAQFLVTLKQLLENPAILLI